MPEPSGADLRWDEVVAGHALRFPDRPALAFRGTVLDYRALARRVDDCCERFERLGIGRGARVALLAPARPEAMITFLAAARLGAVWLGLTPRYTEREIAYVLDRARPDLVLCAARFEGRDHRAGLESLRPALAHRGGRYLYFDVDGDDDGGLFAALAREPGAGGAGVSRGSPADPCMLVFTSGSTGRPKGVLLRQRDLMYRSTIQCRNFAVSDYPRTINAAPINHIGGMHYRGLSLLLAAGTIVYQDRYRPAEIDALMRAHDVNMLMFGSAMLQMLLDEPSFDRASLRRLEWFLFAGAPMPVPLLEILLAHCPRVGAAYGLTESNGSVCYAFTPDPIEVLADSIGHPHPAGEVRVAGPWGEPIEPGRDGELQVRREHCMAGYLDDEAATRAAFTPDGWLRTGDVARVRPDGTLKLVGRVSEMYKSGGHNVYPREVEMVLEEHPAVTLAAVIAVPDDRWHEVGHAFVVLRPDARADEAGLLRWCRERLANYKVPKRLLVRAALPMLASGKIDKVALRARPDAAMPPPAPPAAS